MFTLASRSVHGLTQVRPGFPHAGQGPASQPKTMPCSLLGDDLEIEHLSHPAPAPAVRGRVMLGADGAGVTAGARDAPARSPQSDTSRSALPRAGLRGPRRRDLHCAAASLMPVEEALDQPPVPPLALHEYGGGPAPSAAEDGRATSVLVCGERAGCCARPGLPAAVAGARPPWPVHRYRRTSGTDMTTSSARAALAAAMVIAVMYPSARIAYLPILVRSVLAACTASPGGAGRSRWRQSSRDQDDNPAMTITRYSRGFCGTDFRCNTPAASAPRPKVWPGGLASAPAASRIGGNASANGHSGPDDQAGVARPPPVAPGSWPPTGG